jgi:hypothetical protein
VLDGIYISTSLRLYNTTVWIPLILKLFIFICRQTNVGSMKCMYVTPFLEDHLTLNRKSRTHKMCNVTTVIHPHHQRLYSPGWALASSGKCCQQSPSWAAASQFLQSTSLASSPTPSIRLDFGRPRPCWPPGFVQNKFLCNLFSSVCTTWPARPPLSNQCHYWTNIFSIALSW